MKAIILVAGSGKRMRPFTSATHKTLLSIGDRTVIARIIDPLLANAVTDITLVTGYMAEELKEHLSKIYPNVPLQYIHNERFAQSNNIYSMALALESIEIDSDILLIECDLIFDAAVIERLLASQHANVALVDRYHSGLDGTVVEVSDGIITNVIPPHLQGANFNFDDKYKTLNIYRFSRDFCAGAFKKLLTHYAHVIDDNVYYELILGILIYLQRETVHAEILDGERWVEIDDPNDLDGANFIFDPPSRKAALDGAFGGFWNYEVLDFCYIRNMYFPTGSVLSELRNNLPNLVWNYGSAQTILNRKLAFHLLCDEERVILLNGLSQIYPVLKRHCEGRRVLLPSPSFGEYARSFPGATPYFDEVGLNLEAIKEQSADHAVVIFVNPNNPTGSTLPTAGIYDFAAANTDKLVIVDESFIEFSAEDSIIGLLETGPLDNVILLKSLSKVLGVPGMRLGYCYTSNLEFRALVNDEMPVWNINAMAEYFLEIILKHRESLSESFVQTAKDRAQFAEQLASIPVVERVHRSGANFLLLSLSCNRASCEAVVEALLLMHDVYVSDASRKFRGETSYLRVAVRIPSENARLVECLQSVAEGLSLSQGG